LGIPKPITKPPQEATAAVAAVAIAEEDVTALIAPVTPRSALQKMSTPEQLRGVKNPDLEERADQLMDAKLRAKEEDAKYERLKKVVKFYDAWEPPPSRATRMLFMEQVLLPRLSFDTMMTSVGYRELKLEKMTKLELVATLGECFELEIEKKGEEEHEKLKQTEKIIRVSGGVFGGSFGGSCGEKTDFCLVCFCVEISSRKTFEASGTSGKRETYSKHSKGLARASWTARSAIATERARKNAEKH
jgi:hypothetical protein